MTTEMMTFMGSPVYSMFKHLDIFNISIHYNCVDKYSTNKSVCYNVLFNTGNHDIVLLLLL